MKQVNVIVFGDSLVYGLMDESSLGYTLRLKNTFESLKNGIYSFYNLGIPGETSQELLKRFSSETAMRHQPDSKNIIIIATGINDSQLVLDKPLVSEADFYDHLDELVNKAKKYAAEVVLLGLTRVDESKVAPSPWQENHSYNNNRIEKFDEILEDLAKKQDIEYISLKEVLSKEDLIDGLHPTSNGYEKLYQKIYPVLKSLV